MTIVLVIVAVIALVVLLSSSSSFVIFLNQFGLPQESDNAAAAVVTSSSQINGSARSTNTTSVNTNFLTYENPALGIKMQYPSNWTTSQTGLGDYTNIIGFYSPLENLSDTFSEHVLISSTHYLQNITLRNYSNLAEFVVKHQSAKVVDSKPITLAGGYPAQTIVFLPLPSSTETNPLLNPKVMLVWMIKGNTVYSISYNAEEARYSKYLPLVQKMVGSFEIIK